MAKQLLFNQTPSSGGGDLGNGVLLWENNKPNDTFTGQTANLSQAISNFDFIGFKYKVSSTTTDEMEYIIKKDELEKTSSTTTTPVNNTPLIGLTSRFSSTACRVVFKTGDASIRLGNCFDAGGSIVNSRAIPLQIIGY